MSSVAIDEAIPLAEPLSDPRSEEAARLLDRAIQAGCSDPQVAYMLALAHKRGGKIAEARAALRKIARPDANVFLQMGLLSIEENQPAQAEQEFARSWQMDDQCYAACYNLMLTRLTLGQLDTARVLLPQAQALAPTKEQKRFLAVIAELLKHSEGGALGAPRAMPVFDFDSPSGDMTPAEELALLKVLRSLGQLDTAFALLRTLVAARANSPAVQEAFFECSLARARELMYRCSWTEAQWVLEPLTREKSVGRAHQAALYSLLGCCCFLTQDFGRAASHFTVAVRLVPNDPRLHQNLALAHEFNNDIMQAETHWNRFLELLDAVSVPAPPDQPRYLDCLQFATLVRMASLFASREKWNSVMNYLQRAHRLHPDDDDVLERMFQVYCHSKQSGNARKTLDKLRALRPSDPQLDLYELDLVDVKNLSDIERMLTEIERILRRYPDDHRVEERAVGMVANVIPLMGNLCDQLTEQLNKVMGQVQHLPRYQIDWSALHEIMRDLIREFQKLRRITGKCLPLVSSDEHKRIVRELADHIDQKIETCRSMGG